MATLSEEQLDSVLAITDSNPRRQQVARQIKLLEILIEHESCYRSGTMLPAKRISLFVHPDKYSDASDALKAKAAEVFNALNRSEVIPGLEQNFKDFWNENIKGKSKEVLKTEFESLIERMQSGLKHERGSPFIDLRSFFLVILKTKDFSAAMEAIKKFTETKGINAALEGGWTMLHVAVRSNRFDIVQSLLESGADPNISTTNRGSSPLFLADNINMVETLVKNGADLSKPNLAGETAYEYLKRRLPSEDIEKLNLLRGGRLRRNTPVERLASREIPVEMAQDVMRRSPSFDSIKAFILSNGGADARLTRGWSFTHCAVHLARKDVVKFLADSGANFNKKTDSSGRTPLFLASSMEMVNHLIRGGAKMDITDKMGNALFDIVIKQLPPHEHSAFQKLYREQTISHKRRYSDFFGGGGEEGGGRDARATSDSDSDDTREQALEVGFNDLISQMKSYQSEFILMASRDPHAAFRLSDLLGKLSSKTTFVEMKLYLQSHRREADENNVHSGMKKLFDAITVSATPEEALKEYKDTSPGRSFGR